MGSAYYYPTIVKPILPQVVTIAPANLANWYDSKPLQIIQKPSAYPAIEQQYSFAYPNAKNDITNQFMDNPVIVSKPGAYYYEQQSRPLFPIPFVAGAVTNVAAEQEPAAIQNYRPDYTRAITAVLKTLSGLGNVQPINQYQYFDSVVNPTFISSKVAQALVQINAASNLAPITVAPFISLVSSHFQQIFPQWQKPHQIAQQANIVSLANETFPIPFVASTVFMSSWWVDRLPWNPTPTTLGAEAEMVQGGYPPLEAIVNPVSVDVFGWKIEPLWINRYPTWNGTIGQLLSQVPVPIPIIQLPTNFLVPAQDGQPQRVKPNLQAIYAIPAHASGIFPIPFVPSAAVPAAIFTDPPVQRIDALKNFVALILSAVGGREQGLASQVPIDANGWKSYDIWPYKYPTPAVALANLMNQLSTIAPLTIAPFVSTIASYFQEWAPQFQKPWSYTAAIRETAFIRPTFPIPFVPAPPPSIAGYQQDVYPQLRTIGLLNWLAYLNGQVSNIFPSPGPFPPPSPCTTPPPFGSDGDININYFGGNAQPTAVLLCRICKSGKPLLVRGDYAIWCQDCCAFVSKQDTVMMTVRAPKTFKNIF